MNSHRHAVSAARHWGGYPEEYLPIEEFIDSSKQVIGDVRHRSVYHHTLGVWLCQKVFGTTLTVSKKSGKGVHQVPVREIAERHIIEDLGWLPSPADYIKGMPIHQWMSGPKRATLPISHLLGPQPESDDEGPLDLGPFSPIQPVPVAEGSNAEPRLYNYSVD